VTLRVELSIIPFGDETKKRVIETINISNLGVAEVPGRLTLDDPEYEYVVEHNDYKKFDDNTLRVYHKRNDGALRLAAEALDRVAPEPFDDFGFR